MYEIVDPDHRPEKLRADDPTGGECNCACGCTCNCTTGDQTAAQNNKDLRSRPQAFQNELLVPEK